MGTFTTATGVTVHVADEDDTQLPSFYKRGRRGARRRADTGVLSAQPAIPSAPAEPTPVRTPREPEPTTAQLEQQLQSRRARSADQR
jgi:hypothetical protein